MTSDAVAVDEVLANIGDTLATAGVTAPSEALGS
jgi:hypothetical protein